MGFANERDDGRMAEVAPISAARPETPLADAGVLNPFGLNSKSKTLFIRMIRKRSFGVKMSLGPLGSN